MPKNLLKVDKFHGGQNNDTDPRDIQPEESASLQDLRVDRIGRIKPMGSSKRDTSKTEAEGDPALGYGLHTYNSGWGFQAASGLLADHAVTTSGTSGPLSYGILDFSAYRYNYNSDQNAWDDEVGESNFGIAFSPANGTICKPSTTGPGHSITVDNFSGFDCIVLGIFVQKWVTADNGDTYTKAGNPIPLFGTAGSGFHLGKNGAGTDYDFGVLPNGGTLSSNVWRMPWNTDGSFDAAGSAGSIATGAVNSGDYQTQYYAASSGVPGAGSVTDYDIDNFLVIFDEDDDIDNANGFIDFALDSSFADLNGINYVYGQLNGARDLVIAMAAAINANTTKSGFTAEVLEECILKIEEKAASGAAYTFFSDYNLTSPADGTPTIASLEDSDDIWSGASTGTNYDVGLFTQQGNEDGFSDDAVVGAGNTLVPDLIMVAGMTGHDSAPSGYNQWKGALNWYNGLFDNYASIFGSGDQYNDTGRPAISVSDVEDYFLANPNMHYFNSTFGLGDGGAGTPQQETVTFSGTIASGNSWTISINGTEHTVSEGASVNSVTIDATNKVAAAFGHLIEDGAQEANVVASPTTGTAGNVLTVTANNSVITSNFSLGLWSDGTQGVVRVDDERLAWINAAAKLKIHSSDSEDWIDDASINNTGWSTSNAIQPVMYSEGGTLRLSDSNFTNANTPKVMQYYQTGDLCGKSGHSLVGHKLFPQDMGWKYSYESDESDGVGSGADQGVLRAANHDTGVHEHLTNWNSDTNLTTQRWKFTFESTGSGDWSGNHRFFATAVYQDGAESLPSHSFSNVDFTKNTGAYSETGITSITDFAFGTNTSLKIRMVCNPGATSEWMFDHRMSGINIYHTKEEDSHTVYYKVCDINFRDGLVQNNGVTTAWSNPGGVRYSCTAGNTGVTITGTDEDDTFENTLGYDSNSKAIKASWKHATIANGRAWIGAVRYVDDTGTERDYNDRMIASPPFMYDIFPTPYGFVDIDIGDGDAITALTSAHGRLLQFKSKIMYLYNIAAPDLQSAFVESTHPFRGVTKPYHVTNIANGVAWANESGVFSYEGDEVIELMMAEGDEKQRIIKLSDWQDFFSDNSVIAYSPFENIIIIKRNIDASAESGASEADIYVFEFNTGSWTTGKERLIRNKDCTNFITMQDGTLITMANGSAGDDTTTGDPV